MLCQRYAPQQDTCYLRNVTVFRRQSNPLQGGVTFSEDKIARVNTRKNTDKIARVKIACMCFHGRTYMYKYLETKNREDQNSMNRCRLYKSQKTTKESDVKRGTER